MKIINTEKENDLKECVNKIIKKFQLNILQLESISSLTGDASTRKYYRAFSIEDKTYLICEDENLKSTPIEKYDFNEIQKFLFKENILVPKIFGFDQQSGILLLEDLGDITLLNFNSQLNDVGKEEIIYQKCLNVLRKLQNLPIPKGKCYQFTSRFFDAEKLMQEIGLTNEFFLKKLLKTNLKASEEAIIQKGFREISDFLSSQEKVFVHRDFHSRNIMIKDQQIYLIDFQDARLGNVAYDLASLLDDCYYEVGEKNYNNLLRSYWECLKEDRNMSFSFEEFYLFYGKMVVQRTYKAIGSFAYIKFSKEDERYLKYIGFGMQKLKKFLFLYPEYTELRKIIFTNYHQS